ATGSYSDSSTADVTHAVVWSSADPTIATIGASSGVATGVALGPVTISATSDGISATDSLTVVPTTWHQTGSMATQRSTFTITALSNGSVLVAGGENNDISGMVASELYDPNSGTWTSAANMITPRKGHTATLLQNNKVLVAGG